jgi:hypothetical protein
MNMNTNDTMVRYGIHTEYKCKYERYNYEYEYECKNERYDYEYECEYDMVYIYIA